MGSFSQNVQTILFFLSSTSAINYCPESSKVIVPPARVHMSFASPFIAGLPPIFFFEKAFIHGPAGMGVHKHPGGGTALYGLQVPNVATGGNKLAPGAKSIMVAAFFPLIL